jgi:hypothetical protein
MAMAMMATVMMAKVMVVMMMVWVMVMTVLEALQQVGWLHQRLHQSFHRLGAL